MKHFEEHELEFYFGRDSDEEQKRTREIFEELEKRAKAEKPLLEREKDFFCRCLKLSDYVVDGNPEDYQVCNDFLFKHLYPIYFSSGLKSDAVYKPHKGKLYLVPLNERIKDLKFLYSTQIKWLKKIETTNHSDQLLQTLASETRNDLKKLKRKEGTLFFKKQKKQYALKKEKQILHSKFIYLLVKKTIQNYEESDFKFEFMGKNVEIDAYSLIHIINRHYAEIIKENTDKTYHIEDFEPDLLHIKLKDILNQIEEKKVAISNTEKIAFRYNDQDYRIWLKERVKFKKGIGKIEFSRLETFYPIGDEQELKDLSENFKLIVINEQLQTYIEK
ncbi:hypothetical protein [Zunongwangia endophytica]|uniref:WYL domain-containing protein n=1 Tax=Zunongwangia endophytica TaxID=1808945 RepID=A0ABV8HCQ0_9FLAO|nr:hypothetical protein [Zunongwangia endophytica]MDN3593961.1 hypothetical protein [Zunongwangia endophytica]